MLGVAYGPRSAPTMATALVPVPRFLAQPGTLELHVMASNKRQNPALEELWKLPVNFLSTS
jgi:hypothetical protein